MAEEELKKSTKDLLGLSREAMLYYKEDSGIEDFFNLLDSQGIEYVKEHVQDDPTFYWGSIKIKVFYVTPEEIYESITLDPDLSTRDRSFGVIILVIRDKIQDKMKTIVRSYDGGFIRAV